MASIQIIYRRSILYSIYSILSLSAVAFNGKSDVGSTKNPFESSFPSNNSKLAFSDFPLRFTNSETVFFISPSLERYSNCLIRTYGFQNVKIYRTCNSVKVPNTNIVALVCAEDPFIKKISSPLLRYDKKFQFATKVTEAKEINAALDHHVDIAQIFTEGNRFVLILTINRT